MLILRIFWSGLFSPTSYEVFSKHCALGLGQTHETQRAGGGRWDFIRTPGLTCFPCSRVPGHVHHLASRNLASSL